MSRIIIDIPDCYPRVEGFIELYGVSIDGKKLPYRNFVIDHALYPHDLIKIKIDHE